MSTIQNAEQMQIAGYLIQNYGYHIVLNQNSEIWLTSRTHERYPVIRISSQPAQEGRDHAEQLRSQFLSYAGKKHSQENLLDLHLCADTETMNPAGIDIAVLDRNHRAGHDAEQDFPGISRQLRPVSDPDAEIARIQDDLKEYEKYKPKQRKISKYADKPVVTYVFLGICILIYLLIHFAGIADSTTESAILYGAYYKPMILAGEWWRLFTTGLVHIQTWHLLMNMLSLLSLGFALEQMYGRWRYFLILTASVICGSLFIFAFQGNIVTVGLSGGLYGLMAAYIAYVVLNGGWDNPAVKSSLIRTVGINLLINFVPGISWQAHLGGACCGFVLGILLADKNAFSRRYRRIAAAGGIVLTVILAFFCPRNAYIPDNQMYLGSDIRILNQEKKIGLSSYADWIAGNLSQIYDINLSDYLED